MHFAFCIAIYLLTLTHVHTFDALSYILDVDRKPWPELFHPHHLAYGPLGALIRAVAFSLGWHGSAATLIQSANALAGAAGVTIFAGVVRRATARADLAAAGALLLGSSYAFWYYAVEVEVYTIASLFLIMALALIVALLRRPSLALATALGLAQGVAVLFHQTNVLLGVPVAVALLLADDQRPTTDDRPTGSAGTYGWSSVVGRRLIAYTLPLAAIVVGSYLWVGLGVSGFRSWPELSAWMEGYARTGWWGGAVDGSKLAGLGAGLSRAVAPPGWEIIPVGLLAVLLIHLRGLRSAPRGLPWVLLAWLLTYGAFFLWWEPENIEFWIASLPAFYLLLLLAVAGKMALSPGRSPAAVGEGRLGARWSVAALIILGLAMLGVNLASIRERGDASTDLQRVITDALAARSAPGDLMLVPDGLLELYLPYYAGRENIVSLSQAMTASGGDWVVACDALRRRVDLALSSGYTVLAVGDALRPSPAPPGEPPSMMERFHLTPGEVAACYAPLSPMFQGASLGPGLPEYHRIASAQELADSAGWDFRRGAWGWHAANISGAAVTAAGWELTPGSDPSLSSPPLAIDSDRYGAIELRMSADTAARDAQLFFLDGSGHASEERSLRLTLQPGPEMHTYRLDLRGAPGWGGRLGGLRLDPVGAGDGGKVTVEALRLLP